MMDEKQKELLKKFLVRPDFEQLAYDNAHMDEKELKKIRAFIEKTARLLAKHQKNQKEDKQ